MLSLAGVLAAARLVAQPAPPPVPIEQRGPHVGQHVPAFRLKDQSGREQDLASLAGPKGLVLLFVRSADW
ncbi:MAG: peroxiredoxin family protein [Acidobacteriota bacterium]|nr:peroxiredoxin family protein [Acidobacteriota bacterium]